MYPSLKESITLSVYHLYITAQSNSQPVTQSTDSSVKSINQSMNIKRKQKQNREQIIVSSPYGVPPQMSAAL